MNISFNICYFVIRKCDCIGVYLVAIQSKSFKNVMAINNNNNNKFYLAKQKKNITSGVFHEKKNTITMPYSIKLAAQLLQSTKRNIFYLIQQSKTYNTSNITKVK